MIKRLFATVTSTLILLAVFPVIVLAATNYGDGNYGDGVYGGGDTPSTNSSSEGAPGCNNSVTTGKPDLFEIRTTKNSATLYFAPPVMPYSNFYIAYSQKPNVWQYGVQFDQGSSGGVLKYTINKLNPKTKYYFMIRPGNGCMAGNWGNTMTAITTSSGQIRIFYKNLKVRIAQQTKAIPTYLSPIKKVIDNLINTVNPKATVAPTTDTQTQVTTPTTTPAKAKFCFLWWCF